MNVDSGGSMAVVWLLMVLQSRRRAGRRDSGDGRRVHHEWRARSSPCTSGAWKQSQGVEWCIAVCWSMSDCDRATCWRSCCRLKSRLSVGEVGDFGMTGVPKEETSANSHRAQQELNRTDRCCGDDLSVGDIREQCSPRIAAVRAAPSSLTFGSRTSSGRSHGEGRSDLALARKLAIPQLLASVIAAVNAA